MSREPMTPQGSLDLEHLLRLKLVVGRIGEMDLAQWWNTRGQLGPSGASVLRRGLPRTHYFAQARSVFAVAAQRCSDVFNPPGSITLWRLPPDVEEAFDAGWEHWLDSANGSTCSTTSDLLQRPEDGGDEGPRAHMKVRTKREPA